MEMYSGGRRTGKTWKLVQEVLADPLGMLVEPNSMMVLAVLNEYPEIGPIFENDIRRTKIISYSDRHRLMGVEMRNLYFDNVDMLLSIIFSGHAITAGSFVGQGYERSSSL